MAAAEGARSKKRTRALRLVAALVAQGVSVEYALSQTETEQLALYIAIGEQKGGEWDYDDMSWGEPPKPQAVYAVLAEMK